MSLQEEHVFELPLGQLVALVQLFLLHLPDGSFPLPHQLLLLLEELPVQQGDLLLVGVGQPPQLVLVGVLQLAQVELLLQLL